MSKIKIQLRIPGSLKDITLGQYQEYLKILQGLRKDKEDDGELTDGEIEFLNKKTLQIFCNVELKDTYNLPLSAFMVALEQVQACFSEETPLVREFIFKDSEGTEQQMGFIPKLDDMTFGEYVDLDSFIGDWENMHKAMAVLFRRKTMVSKQLYQIADYTDETVEQYAEAMKEMPVNIAMGAVVFFYRLGMKLADGMMSYLETHKELGKQFRDSLPNGGVGIRALLLSQMETSLNLMKYQRFHSVKP